jgi:4-hydroxy-tetrahydrodipicolinate synthase
MVVPPYYHHASKEGMYQYYKTVAESVNIGIMIYNNPDVSGTLIPPDLVARLAKIDNIVATKDNSPIAADYAFKALLIDPEDMVLINGLGELQYVGSAAYGNRYRGFVSFLANFAPRLSYAIYEAVEEGNFKKAYQSLQKIFPLFSFMARAQSRRESISVFPEWLRAPTMFISIGKVAMDLVGLRGGPYHPGQLPLEELTDQEKQELKTALKEMGVI